MPGIANDLNISQLGIQSFNNTNGVFTGVTITGGTGITVTNGNGQAGNPTISLTGGGVAVEHLTGNSGGQLNPDGSNNFNIITNNSTVRFVGSGSTLTQDFGLTNLIIGSSASSIAGAGFNVGVGLSALNALTSGISNVAVGRIAGTSLTSGINNVLIGASAGNQITTSTSNVAVGQGALNLFTTGAANAGSNCAFGDSSLNSLTTGINNAAFGDNTLSAIHTGGYNIALGYHAGISHTLADSSNIDIGNTGTLCDSNVMRIGTQGSGNGQQNTCFIAGITGVTVSSAAVVTLNTSTGQLGELAQLTVPLGGTGAATLTGILTGNGTSAFTASTVTQHGVLVGGASNAVSSTAVGTTGQVLQANTGADPTYSTATYPSTTTINQILYSSSANVVAGLATANNGVLTTGTTGIPVITALASNGQLIIGSGAGAPAAATLTAGAGISITNAANSITIAATSAGFTWSETSGAFNAAKENGYFITTTATATLPASPAEGDTIKFSVDSTNLLTITANAGQTIRFSSAVTAVAGTAVSTIRGDSAELTYKSTGTVWIAQNFVGNWVLT